MRNLFPEISLFDVASDRGNIADSNLMLSLVCQPVDRQPFEIMPHFSFQPLLAEL